MIASSASTASVHLNEGAPDQPYLAAPERQNAVLPVQNVGVVASKCRWLNRHPRVLVAVAVFLLVVLFAIGFAAGWSSRPPETGSGLHPDDDHCIGSPAEFETEFKKRVRSSSQLESPACVVGTDGSEGVTGLMGVVHLSKRLGDDALLQDKGARQVVFAFGSDTLEKILVYGPNGGRAIVDNLGLGNPDPGTAHLMVWTVDPEVHPVSAWWINLEEFLTSVYGDATPDVQAAVDEIQAQNFTALTGCEYAAAARTAAFARVLRCRGGRRGLLTPRSAPHRSAHYLVDKPWDTAGAGCSEEYITAAAQFPFVATGDRSCSAASKKYGSFETCYEAEQHFLDLAHPTAIQLRAFLAQNNGFNPLFTGYGYTAEDYPKPLVREYWVKNVPLSDLGSDRRYIEFQIT